MKRIPGLLATALMPVLVAQISAAETVKPAPVSLQRDTAPLAPPQGTAEPARALLEA